MRREEPDGQQFVTRRHPPGPDLGANVFRYLLVGRCPVGVWHAPGP